MGNIFPPLKRKVLLQNRLSGNKHHYYPGCCATKIVTRRPPISICSRIHGDREDNHIKNKRQEEVGVGFCACCWRKCWQTGDEGTWRPIRKKRPQKLCLISAILKHHFCIYITHNAADFIQHVSATKSVLYTTSVVGILTSSSRCFSNRNVNSLPFQSF